MRKKLLIWPITIFLLVLTLFIISETNAEDNHQDTKNGSPVRMIMGDPSGRINPASADLLNDRTKPVLESFLNKYPNEWRMFLHKGFVKRIQAPIASDDDSKKTKSPLTIQAPYKDTTAAFLKDFAEMFGVEFKDFLYIREFSLRDKTVVEYRQTLENIPIEHSFISFSIKNSKIEQVTSRVYPDVYERLHNRKPAITAQNASNIAFGDMSTIIKELGNLAPDYSNELVILPDDGGSFFLTWRVIVSSSKAVKSYTYYINAITGNIIKKYSNIRNQNVEDKVDPSGVSSENKSNAIKNIDSFISPSSCSGATGNVKGYIFEKNKNDKKLKDISNMKVNFIKNWWPDSYSVTDDTGYYSSTTCSDQIKFELQGYGDRNFVKVIDCNTSDCSSGENVLDSGDIAFSSPIDYTWNLDQEGTRQLTVFWHINKIHDKFKTLVGSDLMNYQIKAYFDWIDPSNVSDPTCKTGTLNAFYWPSKKNIYFCPSEISGESDIIYHEYTHGFIDHISGLTLPYQNESGALDEGIADYFAASINNDPLMAEGLGSTISCTGSIPRNIETCVVMYNNKCDKSSKSCSNNTYWLGSSDHGYVHHNSHVISGFLWDLRKNSGLSVNYVDELIVDTLVLEKPISFPELSFPEFLSGLIAQDKNQNTQKINTSADTRGLTTSITVTTFKINNDSASTTSRTVTLNNTCTGSPTHYMASESSTFSGASWVTYSTAPSFTLSSGNGTKTVYFKVKNSAGESSKVNDSINLGTPPTVTTFKINNDATSTTSRTVTLNNTCTGSPTHYMASESSTFSGASWVTYSTAPSFTLSSGNGTKTVYFKVKNSAGESSKVNDSINMEVPTPPTVTTFKINNDATSTTSRTVTLNNTCTGSPTHYMASESSTFSGASWITYSTAPSFTLSSGNVTKTVYFKVKNSAGPSTNVKNDSINLEEPTPPTVTNFKINNDAASTTSRTVTLNNTCTGSPTHYMASESSTFSGASWVTYSTAPSFTLSSGNVTKTVYFKVKNSAGTSSPVSDGIELGTLPTVTSFKINNDAASTTSRTVTLNNTCTGSPTHYMASESSTFSGASWVTYSTAPSFTLSSGNVTKTVYFKVKNSAGESQPLSDSLTLAIPEETWNSTAVNWRVDYELNWNKTGTITVPGATKVRVHFSTINTESGYDHLLTNAGDDWSGNFTSVTSKEKTGNSITLTLNSDYLINGYFIIDKVEYVGAAAGTTPTKSGDLIDSGSSGETWNSTDVNWRVDYGLNWNKTGTITVPGATKVRVYFSTIHVESGYDHLLTNAGDDWSGNFTNVTSKEKTGNSITLTLNSDYMINGYFIIDKVEYVGVGNDIYLTGGENSVCGHKTLNMLYHTDTNIWETKASMQTPRIFHRLVALDGKIYAIGGSTSCSTETASMEMYDPATNTWTSMASIPGISALQDFGAVAVGGYIYVMAGHTANSNTDQNIVKKYDPSTNTWSSLSNAPFSGAGRAVAIGQYIYFLSSMSGRPFWEYNIATNTWTALSSYPATKYGDLTVVDGKAYYVASDSNSSNPIVIHQYDRSTDKWTQMPSSSPWASWRVSFAAPAIGNKIYVIGGNNNGYTWYNYNEIATISTLSPTCTWETKASMLTTDRGMEAAVLGAATKSGDMFGGGSSTETWNSTTVNWQVDYGLNWNKTGTITVPGATKVRVHFSTIHVESGYDHLLTNAGDDWSGNFTSVTSKEKTGNSITLTLNSDYMINGYFIIDKVEYMGAAAGTTPTKSEDLNPDVTWSSTDVNWQVDYGLNWNKTGTITVPGATKVRVHFSTIHVESGYDHLLTNAGDDWSGNFTDKTSKEKTGNSITLTLNSDYMINGYFIIDKVEYVGTSEGTTPTKSGDLFGNPDVTWNHTDVNWQVDYGLNWNKTGTITVPGATKVRVHFSTINTESWYDHLLTDAGDDWSGSFTSVTSKEKTGNSITLTLNSDYLINGYFIIDKVEYVGTSEGTTPTKSGDLFGSGSSGETWNHTDVNWQVDYGLNWNKTGTITVPGATKVRVHFSTINTESWYDHLLTDAGDDWSGSFTSVTSKEKTGNSITLTLNSDYMINGYCIIDKVEYVGAAAGTTPTKSGDLF